MLEHFVQKTRRLWLNLILLLVIEVKIQFQKGWNQLVDQILLIQIMSLLDQLSSLCMLSMETQTQSPLFSFSIPTPILSNPITNSCKDQRFNDTSHPDSIQKPLHNFQSSEKKMIKLFDDSQLQAKWRFVKTQKKPSLQPKAICLQSQKKQQLKNSQQKLSEFIIQEEVCKPPRNEQDVLIKLTKLNFMFKNKLRKINYEFFVKFQQFSRALLKQKKQKQQQLVKQKEKFRQRLVIKLWETLSIIHTKYVHQEPQQSIYSQFQQGFDRIKSYSFWIKQLCTVTRIHMKLLKRKFLTNLQKINKRFMKVELFENILKTVMIKKVKGMFAFFVESAKFSDKRNSVFNGDPDKGFEISWNRQANDMNHSRIIQKKSFIVISSNTQNQLEPTHLYPSTITSKNPLSLPTKLKPHKPNCLQQPFLPLSQPLKQQNIPLKLHSIKPHEQLYNLNDCIDNGHLLINMVQSDKSFRQELQNLTISKINNNSNTTSSMNSSVVGDQNFLLPQEFNIVEPLIGQAPVSMRKHIKRQTQVSEGQILSMKHTKQPRKSLVVTNLKDFNCGGVGSSKQQLSLNYKDKAKSTTNSSQKIPSKTKIMIQNDRDAIKKMLDQLNKRFLQTDNTKCKASQKKLSNKKQSSKNESAKNTERKKVKSQLNTVVNAFNDKTSNKKKQPNSNSKNNSNSGKKEYYRIDLVGSSSKKQSQTKNHAAQTKKHNSSTSFMSVILNQSKYENVVLKDKREIEEVYQNLIERRFKQTRSELANQFGEGCESGQMKQRHNQEEENFGETSYFGSRKQSMRNEPYMRIDLMSNNGLKKKSHDISELKDDSFLIKRSSKLNFSSDNDTTLHEYINYIPSTMNIQQQQQYYPQSQSHNYISQKPIHLDATLSNIEQQNSSHHHSTLNKPSSMNTSLQRKRQSFQKNRQSFQKNRHQWDLMFQKQKSKFLNSSSSNKITKRKSTLNEEVILEIRSKIEKCLVLNDKDTNVGVRDKCYTSSYGNSVVGSLGNTIHMNKKRSLANDNQKVSKGTGVFSVKNSKQKKAVSTKLTTTSKFLKKLQS